MKYFEVHFTVRPDTDVVRDVLSAVLAEIGFESFVATDGGLDAYVQQRFFDAAALDAALADFPMETEVISYEVVEAEDKDWNKEWENNFFTPIVIDGRCVIHSTFHHDVPAAAYDIIINPQMAFGTGHHATTAMMVEEILDLQLSGRSVLDMGCGTSVLAILASKRGADKLLAVDIDSWCVDNSRDNIRLNDVCNIEVAEGDAASLAGKGPFDVVLANINRNILLEDIPAYVAVMSPGAMLCMSGFYVEDVPFIRRAAEEHGLFYVHCREKDGWAMAAFSKL